jgi:hypothetical protein
VLSFNTPSALAIGRRGGRLAVLDLESSRVYEEALPADVDLAEVGVEGVEVRGHIALASFSTNIVKAVAVDGEAYTLDSRGLVKLKRAKVSLKNIKMREFGPWDDAYNKALLILKGESALVLGASRAGALLHLSFAGSDKAHIDAALRAVEELRKFGDVSITCSCRLGPMPLEILAKNKNEYILAKIYMNIASDYGQKALVIRGSGGNISKRFTGPLAELNKYIAEVF